MNLKAKENSAAEEPTELTEEELKKKHARSRRWRTAIAASRISKQKSLFLVGTLLLVLFICVSIFTFKQSNRLIEEGYLASEGNAAQNFAVLTAANIHLTDEQVRALKACSYAELQTAEENRALKTMMANDSFANKVDYAYVMVHLTDEEIKYSVTERNQAIFDAPPGTKLDIMWLLDVNVNEGAVSLNVGSDEQRYSYYIEEDTKIFNEAPTYLYHSSEWGDHICGYAPLRSTEGSYIGVVGVELRTGDYEEYRSQAMYALGLLITVSTLMLTLLFFFLYRKYSRIQFDKIYTDSLTQISNRSYYNDRFIRRMNSLGGKGRKFALMIADVDWFKKVNDTFGHEAGDEVLIELSEILLRYFGKEHVVRFGGEEFVIGLWVESETELRWKIDAIYESVAQRKFGRREITISISLGCCYCEPKELDGWLMSNMLRAADCMLYECKENGRAQYRLAKFEENREYQKAPHKAN
ncbi:MAG: diguanylate cyclase [Eubacteriales bacterium]|nr:diguanylate cyclase [Eubacteriales bacterium]